MEEEVTCTPSTPPNPAPKPERAKLQLSSSPPPNCAICLSDCDNKSFTDRCLHQFCFACLLRWSKVKAECPLCKQPFESIIHTVRSVNDYEELSVFSPPTQPDDFNIEHDDITVDFEHMQHMHLPTVPAAPRQRRFQYRTTLYLDPHEDIAIQQMLMSHPLTNTLYMPRRRLTRLSGNSRQAISLDFRHAIYQHNWWVDPTSTVDTTGRHRECSPQFYRNNPAQRIRIAPWLHRELSALLNDNTPHCMYVMAVINDLLTEYHVLSPQFSARVQPYFNDKTDHFIHEFYHFLRSPFDMVGYDRVLQYTQRIQNINIGSSSSTEIDGSESDVEVINVISASTTAPAPRNLNLNTNEVIEITDSDSSNSDVVIREPTPPPLVTISDSDEDDDAVVIVEPSNESVNPPVLEYKKEDLSDDTETTKEQKEERSFGRRPRKLMPMKKRYAYSTDSDSDNKVKKRKVESSSSSSSSSETSSDYFRSSNFRTVFRKKRKRVPRKCMLPPMYAMVKSSSSSSSSSSSNDEYESPRLPVRNETFQSGPSTSASFNGVEKNKSDSDSDSSDNLPLSVLPGCSKYSSNSASKQDEGEEDESSNSSSSGS